MRDVVGAIIQAIVRADDLQITASATRVAGVLRIARVAGIASTAAVVVELAGIDIGAFVVALLANLPLHVASVNAQDLIRAYGRIAA